MTRTHRAPDAGSAVVEFALVGALLTALFLGVLQLGLAVHMRNTLVACAAEGARVGASADRGPADAVVRTRQLVAASLSPTAADAVTATTVRRDGLTLVEVRVATPLPVLGLLGVDRTLEVRAHAVEEAA